MPVKFTNNASGVLAASIGNDPLVDVTITVNGGQGALFPSLAAGDFFYATLVDSSNNLEIVKVTARSTDTMTVVRGQDGTTPRAYTSGDRFELRTVAASLTALGDFTPSGSISATTLSGAIVELDTEKAPLASPTFTGIPAGPTASAGTNTTQLSTTAFVIAERSATATLTNKTFNILSVAGSTSGTASISARAVAGTAAFVLPEASGNLGYLNAPTAGTKNGAYTLATSDVGKYVQAGPGASITIPDSIFSEGDVVSIFNNTTGNITITCSITTAYIAGIDADKATVTLATRGVATVLFISGTVCVIMGTVS